MPAYIIAMVNVSDPEKYKKYAAKASIATEKHGGKFLARGGATQVMEGAVPYQRVVVLQFDSMQKAKDYYNSMEYQDAKSERIGAADFNMVIVEGL